MLPRRVMLRRSFRCDCLCLFSSLIFWTAIRKSFAKVRPIFLKRAQGTVIWRVAHSYMSLCARFVKVSKMHEVVHMVDEVLWKPVDNFCKVDEDA